MITPGCSHMCATNIFKQLENKEKYCFWLKYLNYFCMKFELSQVPA